MNKVVVNGVDCSPGVVAELRSRLAAAESAHAEEVARLRAENARLREALKAAGSVLWMAREYAEAGGSHGLEMRDFIEAERLVRAASGPAPRSRRRAVADALAEVEAALDQHRRFPGPDATALMAHALETIRRALAADAPEGEEGKRG